MEGAQITIMVNFHIIILRIISLLIFLKKWKIYNNNHSTFYKLKQIDKSKVECFKCHKYEHYKSKYQTNLNKSCSRKSNFIKNKYEISILMACHINKRNHQNLYYLDIKWRNHMREDKSFFSVSQATLINCSLFFFFFFLKAQACIPSKDRCNIESHRLKARKACLHDTIN